MVKQLKVISEKYYEIVPPRLTYMASFSIYRRFLFSTLSHWPLKLKQAIFNIFYDYANTLFPHEMRTFAGLEMQISFLSTIYFLIAAFFNNRLFEKSALHCDRFTEQLALKWSGIKINISCLFLWDSLEGNDEQEVLQCCYRNSTRFYHLHQFFWWLGTTVSNLSAPW